MVWKAEEVNHKTGEVFEKTHTYEVAKRVPNAKATNLIPIIEHFVAEGITVVTDKLHAYNGIYYKYNHMIVCHGKKELTVGGFCTNGIEGFWGHFEVWCLVHTISYQRHTLTDILMWLSFVSTPKNSVVVRDLPICSESYGYLLL